uniref:DNA-directed DNA polymerase n=1 Tax=Chlorobium chlorochromatii (strain CaD3) TaxID=340177 RepID=Q3AP20_CHLCH
MENLINHIVTNNLLFGKDKEERIVGAYQLSDTHIRLFNRNGDTVTFHDEPFYPYFFLSDSSLLETFVPENQEKFWLVPLAGSNYYTALAIFKSSRNHKNAVDFLNRKWNGNQAAQGEAAGKNSMESNPFMYNKGDTITQYLMQSGKTMFKGMLFDDIYRMQLDIETNYNGEKKGFYDDEIIIISLSDNRGWEQPLHSKGRNEKELLQELIAVIQEKDPDVIEGHNIFNFDLPYIQRRCERHSIPFTIGRNQTIPRTYPSSIRFGERTIDFPYCDIPGRHVIDTLFLVQGYDVAKRSIESYGLKNVARHFGFASANRTYIEYKDIARLWQEEPNTLLAYALDDVRETQALSSLLSGSNFYMTQMLPYSYAMTARLGQAAKIEALFVREYLREKHSLPKPTSGQQQSGGYTEVFLKGILGPIVYADVESLYPSIMLSYNVCPKSDALRVFPNVLRSLKELRFKAKDQAQQELQAGNKRNADNFDAMQASFKIIINAMYGYLGYSGGIFNDYGEADRVTTTGQGIARKMIAEFEKRGCKIIEVDTDGIFFIPPASIASEQEEKALVEEVSQQMPDGINIGFDGRFKKMISYMKKNYALLSYNNVMKLKGSSLNSRSAEKFGREFIRRGFQMLLAEDIKGLHLLFAEYKEKILNHQLSIEEFSRSESLKQTKEQYLEDVASAKRSKSITYELAIRKGMEIRKGDKISYYITGSGSSNFSWDKGKLAAEWDPNKPDENSAFYLKRLDEYSQKFLPFFKPQDYSMIFSTGSLFAFSEEGIELLKEIPNTDSQTE